MIERSFGLIPFSAPALPAVSINGHLRFHENRLNLHYSLEGQIEDILLPPISPNPGRRDDLWKATCFECFLALKGRPEYWEFNFSPSGDWNVYRMDAYRRVGFREEPAVSPLPFEVEKKPRQILLDVDVDAAPIVHPDDEVQIGVTAILRTRAGQETYWALAHAAPHADFHRRESFILALAERTHPSGQSAPGG